MKRAPTAMFLTTAQAAKLLNISVSTLKKFIYLGKIKTLRTPGGHHRILKKDLLALRQLQVLAAIAITFAASLAAAFLFPAPARAELELTPYASVSEEYDSNITFAPENEISDFITRTEVGVTADYEGKLDRVSLTGNIFRRTFADHSGFDNTSSNLRLSVDHEFSRYDRISLTDTFGRGTEPRSLDEEFGRSTGRYTFTKNNLALAYTHDFTSQLSVILRYGNEINEYSREDLAESTANTFGLGAEFAFDSRNVGIFEYRYAIRDYDAAGEATTNGITAGLRHYFSSQLSLEGVAGYEFIESVTGKEYTNPVYIFALTDEITDKLEARLSYRWENNTSSYSTDVFKNDRWTLSFVDRINDRLRVDISGFFGTGTFEVSDESQELKGASLGFIYALTRNINWTGQLSYSEQTSNVAANEYERLYAGTGIKVEF